MLDFLGLPMLLSKKFLVDRNVYDIGGRFRLLFYFKPLLMVSRLQPTEYT